MLCCIITCIVLIGIIINVLVLVLTLTLVPEKDQIPCDELPSNGTNSFKYILRRRYFCAFQTNIV